MNTSMWSGDFNDMWQSNVAITSGELAQALAH